MAGALIMSHWVLGLLTHRPDLPLVPRSDLRVGMGLWNSLAMTVIVEGALFACGDCLYLKSTRPVNRKGTVLLWSLLAFLVFMYVVNLFGPPHPSVEPVGYLGLLPWLLVAWAYWIDRHRTPLQVPWAGDAKA